MLKKMTQLKNKKGFTLIEMIVVLVIIAILIVAAMPSLIGFIDDARSKKYSAEARAVYSAAQMVATEIYGKGGTPATGGTGSNVADALQTNGDSEDLLNDINIKRDTLVVTMDSATKATVATVYYETNDSASKKITLNVGDSVKVE